jgi:hypothetical protein
MNVIEMWIGQINLARVVRLLAVLMVCLTVSGCGVRHKVAVWYKYRNDFHLPKPQPKKRADKLETQVAAYATNTGKIEKPDTKKKETPMASEILLAGTTGFDLKKIIAEQKRGWDRGVSGDLAYSGTQADGQLNNGWKEVRGNARDGFRKESKSTSTVRAKGVELRATKKMRQILRYRLTKSEQSSQGGSQGLQQALILFLLTCLILGLILLLGPGTLGLYLFQFLATIFFIVALSELIGLIVLSILTLLSGGAGSMIGTGI